MLEVRIFPFFSSQELSSICCLRDDNSDTYERCGWEEKVGEGCSWPHLSWGFSLGTGRDMERFSCHGWAFAHRSSHCTGAFSTPDLTGKDSHPSAWVPQEKGGMPVHCRGASSGCTALLSSADALGFLLHFSLTALACQTCHSSRVFAIPCFVTFVLVSAIPATALGSCCSPFRHPEGHWDRLPHVSL